MYKNLAKQEFLLMLQSEAKLQARLEKKRILPAKLDSFSRFVATHPWQVVIASSFVTALALWLTKL